MTFEKRLHEDVCFSLTNISESVHDPWMHLKAILRDALTLKVVT